MVSQDDYPDVWSCEDPAKSVRVEVRIPNNQQFVGGYPQGSQYTWIEIPTHEVEQWVEKGQDAQIQRTAKIEFPLTWGEDRDTVRTNSPMELLQKSRPYSESAFLLGRIYFQDREDNWILTHLGWVGGIGTTGDELRGKLWIYDFAQMLDSVPVSHTFNYPTVKNALSEIAQKSRDNAPIPISTAVVVAPRTEGEYARLVDAIESGDQITSTVILDRELDQNQTVYYSLDQIADQRAEDIQFENLTIDTGEIGFIDINESALVEVPGQRHQSKNFVANHDTLIDMYRWFEDKTNAKLHFEPLRSGESVALVADFEPSRRIFTDEKVIEAVQAGDGEPPGSLPDTRETARYPSDEYSFHQPVTVLKNDALAELRPVNTVLLRGQANRSDQGPNDNNESTSSALPFGGASVAKTYPVVKVRSEALYQAADEHELSGEIIESDVGDLESAEEEAKARLRELISEPAEGEMDLVGEPRLLPFDRVDAYEVCDDTVRYEPEPVSYEVESVKHEKVADDIYHTRVLVGIYVGEEQLTTVEKRMEEV